MNEVDKQKILEDFKAWWRDELAVSHKNNTVKLTDSSEFTINPFLWSYLAYFLNGKADSHSLAEVLLYPRALGTSINTIFGTRFQDFVTKYFIDTFGSSTSGIDIEFIDKLDGRKKYCQLKSGPNIVNKGDVTSVKNDFSAASRLARTNHLDVNVADYVFCLLYGEPWQKNSFVKQIEKDHVVYVGKEFWYHFTGDENFYEDLISSVGQIANQFDMKSIVDDTISELAKDIEQKYPDLVK